MVALLYRVAVSIHGAAAHSFLINPTKEPLNVKPKGGRSVVRSLGQQLIGGLEKQKTFTIANHGCLGNRNDEGRSEMRYVV